MAHDKWSTRLDLQSVPIGHVLDTRMEPTSEEIKGFEDWVCPLNPHPRWERASSLRVTTEDSDGSHVLEYWAKGDQSLLTGDLDWQDAINRGPLITLEIRYVLLELTCRARSPRSKRHKTSELNNYSRSRWISNLEPNVAPGPPF